MLGLGVFIGSAVQGESIADPVTPDVQNPDGSQMLNPDTTDAENPS